MTYHDIQGSLLLNALRETDRRSLAPHLQEVSLLNDHILYEPADQVRYVYFPRDQALAAHVVLMADGTAIEAAMVGNEGVIEGIVSRGNFPAYSRITVTHGGSFYCISATALQQLKAESPNMNDLFARYADCLVAQLLQSIACNATHSIEQRAASWLGGAMDRLGNGDISLTQDQFGTLLGVGRTYVSRVIGRLKEHGIIATRRGGIRIIDRRRLDQASCPCRHLVEAHFDEVLKAAHPEIALA